MRSPVVSCDSVKMIRPGVPATLRATAAMSRLLSSPCTSTFLISPANDKSQWQSKPLISLVSSAMFRIPVCSAAIMLNALVVISSPSGINTPLVV